MIRGSVTASLIGYALLTHVKEFGQLLIEISSLLEKISRGLYYERMKLSYLCTAEYWKHRFALLIFHDCCLFRCHRLFSHYFFLIKLFYQDLRIVIPLDLQTDDSSKAVYRNNLKYWDR